MIVRPMLTVALLFAAFAFLPACRSAAPGGGAKPLSFDIRESGEDATLPLAALLLIQSQDQLDALNSPNLSSLPVNFSRQSLILLALGEQASGGYWARIDSAYVQNQVLHVLGTANAPGPQQMVTQAITYPYAVAIVPKVQAEQVTGDITSTYGLPHPGLKH